MQVPFEIELPGLVAAGSELEGRVLFLEDAPGLEKVRAVKIVCDARVHGSGSEETIALGPLAIHGPFSAPAKVPFQFVIPRKGPTSYEGRYVKITWRVTVTLDIPWAIDPKQTVEFQVVPRPAKSSGVRQVS
jgi:hypothetical protein